MVKILEEEAGLDGGIAPVEEVMSTRSGAFILGCPEDGGCMVEVPTRKYRLPVARCIDPADGGKDLIR